MGSPSESCQPCEQADPLLALRACRLRQNLEESRSVPLPASFSPSDMSYSGVSGQESVLIAGSESGHGAVKRFDMDGRALQTWDFKNICSGIDVSADRKSAYVATADSKEIYRIDLQGSTTSYVASIPGARAAGAKVVVGHLFPMMIPTATWTPPLGSRSQWS